MITLLRTIQFLHVNSMIGMVLDTLPSGVYVDTFQTSNGSESVVSLNLNLFPVFQDTIFASACDSFVWYGNTYTTTGIYTNSFSTIYGCDSVEVLNFSLNNNNTSPIDFELVLDDYCLETHWNIVNSDGIIVHEEGPYDCNINGSGPQSAKQLTSTFIGTTRLLYIHSLRRFWRRTRSFSMGRNRR